MPAARSVMRLALPAVGLAALAVLGAVRPAVPAAVTVTAGSGSVDPVVLVRVVTDGHPQLVPVAVRRVPPPTVAAPAPVVRHVAVVGAPAPVRRTVPGPAPAAVPRSTSAADAYPYAGDTSSGRDAWGFTERQCVSYVAWRLAEAGRAIDNDAQGWGSALDWDEAARRLGHPVSTRPAVGAVAQWEAHESSPYYSPGSASPNGSFVAGSYGHVAWVTKVYADGSVQVAQYNGSGDATYSTMRVKAPRFLSL